MQANVAATTYNTPEKPTYFKHFSVSEGLSQITVSDILQDKMGFMWFSTQNGINRFDGYEFVQYKRDKTNTGSGPIGEFAYKLALDEETGDIWIATSGGLSRYHYNQDVFSHYPLIAKDGKQRFLVSTVVVDRQGTLWAGTRQGLFYYNSANDSFEAIELDIDNTSRVHDVERDKNGSLLVATSQGLIAIDANGNNHISATLSNIEVTDIHVLQSGEIWFSTANQGIYSKPDGMEIFDGLVEVIGLSEEMMKAGVASTRQMQNGDVWVSTQIGLIIVDPNNIANAINLRYNAKLTSIISSRQMTRTFQSRSGLIWQGTWTSGFSIFDPNSLQFKNLNSLPFSSTRGLEKDADDNIWFSTPIGVWKRDNLGDIHGPWTFSLDPLESSSVSNGNVMAIASMPQRNVFWIGTTKGLFKLDPAKPTIEKVPILDGVHIYNIGVDPSGDLWVGSFNQGIYLVDGDSLGVIHHWPVATITKVFAEHQEFVLVGTIEGLFHINKADFALTNLHSSDRPLEQRSPRVVTWISNAQDGHFFIGTQGSGVHKMHLNEQVFTFTPLNPDSHLATLSVGGVQQDKTGNIWVSTTEGIAKVNVVTDEISYYNNKNGAKSDGYYINHSVQKQDGEIFFGGPTGISYFYADDIGISQWQPEIAFTSLKVLNDLVLPNASAESSPISSPIHIADKIVLGPLDNVFSIEFSALDFSAPHENQYSYKLDGFDEQWSATIAKNRVATYTNLDPGAYSLTVKGTNKDGVWSENTANIEIIVTPHWYWDTWSKALWVVIALSFLAAFYHWRVTALNRRSDELTRLVDLRTRALEESNQKLRKLSSQDDLTGLRNRRDFRSNAEQEVSRFYRSEKPFSILMLDIDHFKKINDESGHACGDHVLVECSKVLMSLLRHQDLLARWGGEEFIILAVDTNLTHGTAIAEKIRVEISKLEIQFEGKNISVSFTIGVSEIQPKQSLDDCIRVADENLYIGKRNGRNRTVS